MTSRRTRVPETEPRSIQEANALNDLLCRKTRQNAYQNPHMDRIRELAEVTNAIADRLIASYLDPTYKKVQKILLINGEQSLPSQDVA